MADLEASKINHDNHLLLDQPCLRLPYELLRKNFRAAHLPFEKESTFVKNLLKETANGSLNGKASPQDVRKLTAVADEEDRLYRQMNARVGHMRELAAMDTVNDVKYEDWSRQRLDRLLVDFMLRHDYTASATALADERGIRDLVDIDVFVTMSRIRKSLHDGSVQEALTWCNENKKELRKMGSNLEFMLRCQQYIEMMRTGSQTKMLEAINHARKYITPFNDTFPVEVSNMAGLLAYRPTTQLEPYISLYSADRWHRLASTFVEANLKLLNLPSTPLLHVALTTSLTARVCPICSTELNALARSVRYAHHSNRLLEHDLVLQRAGFGQDTT
ncbi:GID complex subunit containing RING finger motif [Collariella sp. IMI 366227]|nr:GID complex subunit containing RING finger motif [Collariella sp. IMI 366227]